jgi:hypothetical protein
MAAERDAPADDTTLAEALSEMLEDRERLTRTLLGHAPGQDDPTEAESIELVYPSAIRWSPAPRPGAMPREYR